MDGLLQILDGSFVVRSQDLVVKVRLILAFDEIVCFLRRRSDCHDLVFDLQEFLHLLPVHI